MWAFCLFPGHPIEDAKAFDAWQKITQDDLHARDGTLLTVTSRALQDEIKQRMDRFARDVQINTASLDQECERELEKEVELEQERQLEIGRQTPRKEVDWDYSCLFECKKAHDLPEAASVELLASFVKDHIVLHENASAPKLALSCQLYGTRNFFQACAKAESTSLNDYLRWIDASVMLPSSGEIILVSEREADAILALEWSRLAR